MNSMKALYSYNEFHVSKAVRDACSFPEQLYASSGNVILANIRAVREFERRLNAHLAGRGEPQVSGGTLNAMGLLDEIFHLACHVYRRHKSPDSFRELLDDLRSAFGADSIEGLLVAFTREFPPTAVYKGECSVEDYLNTEMTERKTGRVRTNREQTLEELIMLRLANENPAFRPFTILFDDANLAQNGLYERVWGRVKEFFKKKPRFGAFGHDLVTFLKEPVAYAPDNLQQQLDYVRVHWAELFLPGDGEGEDYWLKRLFGGMDLLSEEWKPEWHPTNGGSPDMSPPNYDYLMREYERFSDDKEWMPRVVLMAKTVLVWLFQLSKKYGRDISRLDQVPDEELDLLRDRGFTGLWLIGLWQRSDASKRIKQLCGNPEAAASAYSLDDYEIADNLGGWDALANLRTRLWQRGIRLASDMVPNHTGMDAKWVVEKPDLFVQRRDNPYPQYTFNGVNLSRDGRVAIYLEDHYYSKSDCAVCFKRVDTATGDTRYIYHGNDGTGMPWNDTAQIDFLNPAAREEVMQKILHVARNFPIIRFDAAMVLAKKHIKRLWYPEPGKGGDIATRWESALSAQEFEARIPNEFWREVVDRVAQEVPDTLLLAEAFWMMEGYFTRTLGMHRVYNSAFMNMLKKEENYKYRQTVKNTIQFDPQILKRYVNFMNNPDEETAVAQFGKGDKYFGVCTLMVTMPGLPMFGHGQIEGFEEKYGMEYTRAYRDEEADGWLIDRHNREIFPLMHKRYLFSGVEDFLFYDVWDNGGVNENVFAYSNRCGSERSLVFYNNKYERASGWIKQSCEYAVKTGGGENDKRLESRSISEGLGLWGGDAFYLIFREQRSNLWFIRKSKDICDNGMFVALNGFECQVFLDIRQEEDTDGSLSEICSFLNGSGTPDLRVAWQELHYQKLYAAFGRMFTREFEDAVHSLSLSTKELRAAKVRRATAKSICALVERPLRDFLGVAAEFARAEAESAPARRRDALLKKIAPEKQLSRFRAGISAIGKACAELRGSAPTARKADAAAETAHEGLAGALAAQREGALLSAVYAMISLLAENGLAKRWSLERKISEFLAGANVSKESVRAFFDRAFALSAERQPKLRRGQDGKAFADDALAVARAVTSAEHGWLLCGANDYDGVRWFNKELMDSTLMLWQMILILSSRSKEKRAATLTLFRALAEAKDGAEYKCADFVGAFTGERKKPARASAAKRRRK